MPEPPEEVDVPDTANYRNEEAAAAANSCDEEEAEAGGSSWAFRSRRRFSRFRSVRKKATSFSGWRSSVKWMTADNMQGDLEMLTKGTYLWKVRRKKLQGVACYRRKYKVTDHCSSFGAIIC